jgi:hypothetical protein
MTIIIWRILHTWRWPCRPKHVVKNSENQHTIKLHSDGNITCNTHTNSRFPDFDTRWRWVISFMPLPLYSRGKSPWYPSERRLGGSRMRSGRYEEEEILEPTGTRGSNSDTSAVQRVASLCTDSATPALAMLESSINFSSQEYNSYLKKRFSFFAKRRVHCQHSFFFFID